MPRIFGKYTAEELLSQEFPGTNPLIENFLYERDNVLLVGREKSNKSTLALQICCALSSAEPFLNEFDVPRAVDTVYLQAEGKIANTRKNLLSMIQVNPINKSRILFLDYPSVSLNDDTSLKDVMTQIDSWRKPEVIIIDPLYQAMQGDISSQEDSSKMVANLRVLSDYYKCAQILIHHAHRPFRNPKTSEIMDEGDDSVFGSFVWKAYPDTVFLIEKVRGHKNYRRLTCSTQRMGNVVEALDLVLIEPEPFYLQIKEGQPIDHLVMKCFSSGQPLTVKDLVSQTMKSRQWIHNSIQRLQYQSKLICVNPSQKPALWTLKSSSN